MTARLLITPGEPAGIGPDITLMAALQQWPAELVALCDKDCLAARAETLGLPIRFKKWLPHQAPQPHTPNTLPVLHVPLLTPCIAGQPDLQNAAAVLETLDVAARLCLDKKADALVTGPVHKAVLSAAGTAFTGHTEYLASISHSPQPVMLFVTQLTRMALLTTHLPLASVPAAITPSRIQAVIRLLHQGLQDIFHIRSPRIVVCGLNPHAGDGGVLGDEEERIIIPTLNSLRKEGIRIEGPVAADTAFTLKRLPLADVILAMYHDQALPVIKHMSFGNAVNVTLGLPFLRTSVDHGVAFDIAGTGKADADSLIAAIQQAITLENTSHNEPKKN